MMYFGICPSSTEDGLFFKDIANKRDIIEILIET